MKFTATLTALAIAGLIAVNAEAATAIDREAYSHDADSGAYNPDWLAELPDTLKLSQLSLPGTHDTMSLYGGDIPQTQAMDLREQLEAGIRVLDIRCRHVNDNFLIYHGSVYQKAGFTDVLDVVQAFLTQHPGETVVMRVKEESTPTGNTREFRQTYDAITAKYPGLFWQPGGNFNPALGSVRGKVVLLQNFAEWTQQGINLKELERQGTAPDDCPLNSNWDLYGVWEKAKTQFMAAASGDQDKIYMNRCLTGSTGGFPYFAASGKSSPQTDAPQLMTGLTTLTNPNTYPDFPRVNCLGKLCSIAFLGTNPLSSQFLRNLRANYAALNQVYQTLNINIRVSKRVGMVMMDFPGKSLINNIIAMNK